MGGKLFFKRAGISYALRVFGWTWETRTHSRACDGCHVSTFPGRGVIEEKEETFIGWDFFVSEEIFKGLVFTKKDYLVSPSFWSSCFSLSRFGSWTKSFKFPAFDMLTDKSQIYMKFTFIYLVFCIVYHLVWAF